MRILIDTNIIARLAQPTHHQHRIASQAIDLILARREDACIVPQTIYEFWVLATRPASVNGLNMVGPRARTEIAKAQRIFTLLRDERAIFQHWDRLVRDHDVKGKNAHDARLVAAMYRHGLTHLLTFNDSDFARFPSITVLTPERVVNAHV